MDRVGHTARNYPLAAVLRRHAEIVKEELIHG
jgi:hypothetical protein